MTLIGSNNGNGTAQTLGASGTVAQTVTVATCGSASGLDSTATGLCAQSTQAGATAYGSNAQATSSNTTAIGFRAVASQSGAVAIGYNAQATGDPTVAIGNNSLAAGNNSVALGAGAQATGNNSVALGAGSIANADNTVSVGAPGSERQITHVAPGVNPTDAVNMSQLSQVQANVNNVARNAYSGVAMSMAMTGAVMPTLGPSESGLGAGVGTYQGYSAVALTFKSLSASGKVAWGVGVSSTGSNWGAYAGIGFKW